MGNSLHRPRRTHRKPEITCRSGSSSPSRALASQGGLPKRQSFLDLPGRDTRTQRTPKQHHKVARQQSKWRMPRVLAIVSSHIGADALLSSPLAAESVLVSDGKISQPLGGGAASWITDLKSSAFLKGDPSTGKITAQRPTISAVLLISVAGDRSSVLGILHPEPRYPLNIDAFPEIPFVKIRRWPIENGAIEIDWVVGQPSGRVFKHRLIRYSGDEFDQALKTIREKRKLARRVADPV